MMTLTTVDYAVIGILLYFFYRGCCKGLFKTLIGPLALVIAWVGAYIYYQKTKNFGISLVLCVIGPFIVTLVLSVFLKLWHKATKDKSELPTSSRILGGLFNVAWGGSYIAILLLIAGMIPLRFGWIKRAQDPILESHSYRLVKKWTERNMPAASLDLEKITDVFEDPDKLAQFESTSEYQELMADERLQDMYADKEVAEQLRTKNYGQLLTNPKFQAVFEDPELLKKIFALNQKIMESELTQTPDSPPQQTPPRVISIPPSTAPSSP